MTIMGVGTKTSTFVLLAALILLLSQRLADAQLALNYYAESCPSAESIAGAVVRGRVGADPTMAASLLRMHFHDCMSDGCEASLLVDSTPGNRAEKEARLNTGTLRGFDVIDQIKGAVEQACPGVVSCADIVALAARDAVSFIGGPGWAVPTGRRDGRLSSAATADSSLPDQNTKLAQVLSKFTAWGFTQKEMVVLSGAHTIGTARCSTILPRLYNFPGAKDGIDPSLNKNYAIQLRRSCPPGSTNRIPMDPSNGGLVFDTNYYGNLYNNMGLFISDLDLLSTATTRYTVATQLNSQRFFDDFGRAMEKLGRAGVLTKTTPYQGEIRTNCHRVNSVSASKIAKRSKISKKNR